VSDGLAQATLSITYRTSEQFLRPVRGHLGRRLTFSLSPPPTLEEAKPNNEGGRSVSEERQQHPREPAEGAEEDVGAPGADREKNGERAAGSADDEARASEHPQEPAEGGEEDVEAPGAERAGDSG
jgi:hypothetical protein